MKATHYKLKDNRYDPYRQLAMQERAFSLFFLLLLLTVWLFWYWVVTGLK